MVAAAQSARQMRRDTTPILFVVGLFLLTRLALVGAGAVMNTVLPQNEGAEFTHLLDGGAALDMWYRWDAGFYATIATEGYDWRNTGELTGDMAFLPLYPLLVRGVMDISGCGYSPYLSTCATVSGLVVSNLALLAAAWLLYDLVQRRHDHSTAQRAVLLLLISPSAIFFSGVYTESLFLLWVVLAFWALERRRFGVAVLAACLAALTRSVGIALYPVLLWHAWQLVRQNGRSWRQLFRSWQFYAAHLPLLVFGGYIFYAGLTVGDPLAYFRSYQLVWERDITRSPLDTLLVYFSGADVSLYGAPLSWIDLAAFVASIAFAVAALRYDRAWGLFALAAALIPFASGTLSAMPRFAAVIFPIYVLLALWTRNRWRLLAVSALSIALALFFVARFVTWRWIA
jgi:hypothetical protein